MREEGRIGVAAKILDVGDRNLTKTPGDQEVTKQLRALDADHEPATCSNLLAPPPTCGSIAVKGYSTEETTAVNANKNSQNPFLVKATSRSASNPKNVQESHQWFKQLAAFRDGEHHGWEAAAKA